MYCIPTFCPLSTHLNLILASETETISTSFNYICNYLNTLTTGYILYISVLHTSQRSVLMFINALFSFVTESRRRQLI